MIVKQAFFLGLLNNAFLVMLCGLHEKRSTRFQLKF